MDRWFIGQSLAGVVREDGPQGHTTPTNRTTTSPRSKRPLQELIAQSKATGVRRSRSDVSYQPRTLASKGTNELDEPCLRPDGISVPSVLYLPQGSILELDPGSDYMSGVPCDPPPPDHVNPPPELEMIKSPALGLSGGTPEMKNI